MAYRSPCRTSCNGLKLKNNKQKVTTHSCSLTLHRERIVSAFSTKEKTYAATESSLEEVFCRLEPTDQRRDVGAGRRTGMSEALKRESSAVAYRLRSGTAQ